MRMKNLSYRNRRGLAPLELVLAIPVLLFVLALSVIFGAVACWKVRGEVVARDAIFGRRWPRGGSLDPEAPEWRVANATRSTSNGAQLTELDHPVFQNPLIRGPVISGPAGNIAVNNEMLDPQNHQRVGGSNLQRDPAALAKMGPYTISVRQPLLDGKWQFWQLGYWRNGDRRLRELWDLLNVPEAAAEKEEYARTQSELLAIYNRPEYFVLDRDNEFAEWYGPRNVPNFHPQVPRFRTLDTEYVRLQILPELIDGPRRPPGRPSDRGIVNVPRAMSNAFIRMYRQKLAALPQPPEPLSPAQQAEKAELERKIEILEDFRDTL